MFGKHYLKNYQGVFLLLFKLLDILIVSVTSYFFVSELLGSVPTGILFVCSFISAQTFFLIATSSNIYKPWRGKRLRHELLLIGIISTLSLFVLSCCMLIADFMPISRESVWLLTKWWAIQLSAVCAVRLIIRSALKAARRRGFNIRRIVFVGLSQQAADLIKGLNSHPEFGIACIGCVDERTNPRFQDGLSIPNLGDVYDLPRVVEEHSIDQVWLAYPVTAASRTDSALKQLTQSPVAIRQVLDYGMNDARVTGIMGVPFIDVDVTLTDGFVWNTIKSIIDRSIAAFILLLLAPLLLLVALGVKLSSPGPALYRQTRLTWKNEPFEMLKFRSMPVDAEFEGGSSWSSTEKRTTSFGRFIRATSIDELPQFINVLKGQMSIIGPRPERPMYVEKFRHEIPSYMKKHRVKAGITGWAQVHGLRGDTDLGERIEHDLYYIRNSSLSLDFEIALRTVFNGIFRRNS